MHGQRGHAYAGEQRGDPAERESGALVVQEQDGVGPAQRGDQAGQRPHVPPSGPVRDRHRAPGVAEVVAEIALGAQAHEP